MIASEKNFRFSYEKFSFPPRNEKREDVGRLQTFPKKRKFFCVFHFLNCLLFVVTVGDGHLHTFYIEKIFTFFLACVKYTYECHRPSLPSFSGFFALFCDSRVAVGGGHLKTFPKKRKFLSGLQSGFPRPVIQHQPS